MSDTKPAEVVILSEKIGLPVDASADAIVERVYEMSTKLERAELILAEKDHLLRRAEDGEAAKAELKTVNARLFIERAIGNQWIDKKDEGFYVKMYAVDPAGVEKHIEDQKFRSFLSGSQRLRENGDPAPTSATKQIEAMALALMATDKTLTRSMAEARVQDENPELTKRYEGEMVAGGNQ